jgi:hypothetical protein
MSVELPGMFQDNVYRRLQKHEGEDMTRGKKLGVAGLCCGLLLAVQAVGQQPATQRQQETDRNPALQQRQQQQQQAQRQQGQSQKLCMATDLIGMKVKVQGEEEWGQVKNLAIDNNGEIQYVAISQEKAHASTDRSAADRSQTDRSATDRAQADRSDADRSQAQRSATERPQGATASSGQITLVPWDMAEIHSGQSEADSYVSLQIDKEKLSQAPTFTEQQLTSAEGQQQLKSQVDQFFQSERRGVARPELNRERDASDRQSPERSSQPQTPQQRDN